MSDLVTIGRRPPKLVVYDVATPGLRAGWNRYHHPVTEEPLAPIGVYVVVGRWCVSFVWRTQPPFVSSEHKETD